MNGIRGQKIFLLIIGLTMSLFFLNAQVLRAQADARLDLKTTAEKEIKIQKAGKWVTERIPMDKTGPGDVLVYTVTYLNMGNNSVVDATVVDPIPAGTAYVINSAEGKDAEIACSIDGGRTFQKPPAIIQVKKPDGVVENKPAPADRYTHIRWVIKKPVPPGASGRVSLKVTVK